MTEPIILPSGVSIAILAFLLSLLPAGLFIWIMFLRRHERPVPPGAVTLGFLGGMMLVGPAFWLERRAPLIWEALSPQTVHYFDGAILPLQTVSDLFWPAVGTFAIVALVEEGLRFLLLAGWYRWSAAVDQVFDGLVIGLAAGLGFATLENTLYFFQLFAAGQFDALVFVFFLRFLISTLAHISFGGIMGALVARSLFSTYRRWHVLAAAFIFPWFMHGLYDWLLGVQQTMYAVLLLLIPLFLLIVWSNRREFFVINRSGRRLILEQRPPESYAARMKAGELHQVNNPWNLHGWWTQARPPVKPSSLWRKKP